ncbi:MAG: hypothetical protein EXR29_10150 [Betaproteobacteria bacterium]|nr:hypothetical protein [Betaproteobacteria bacterium]
MQRSACLIVALDLERLARKKLPLALRFCQIISSSISVLTGVPVLVTSALMSPRTMARSPTMLVASLETSMVMSLWVDAG